MYEPWCRQMGTGCTEVNGFVIIQSLKRFLCDLDKKLFNTYGKNKVPRGDRRIVYIFVCCNTSQ